MCTDGMKLAVLQIHTQINTSLVCYHACYATSKGLDVYACVPLKFAYTVQSEAYQMRNHVHISYDVHDCLARS
jgi:hypothetical protein